ncbi:hypothetical protein D3C72_1396200 [compost metagenome]
MHAMEIQGSAHGFGQRAADGQAQPAAPALAARVGLLEGLEQVTHLRWRDADAAVDDFHQQCCGLCWRIQLQAQLYAAYVGELDGIAEEVVEKLPQAIRIGRQQRERRLRHAELQGQCLLLRLRRDGLQCLRADCGNVAGHQLRLESATGQAGEIQCAIEQSAQCVARTGSGSYQFALAGRQRRLVQQID